MAAIQAVNADYLKGVLAADTAMRQIDALLPAPSVEPARNAQEGAVPPAKGPGGAGSYSLNGIDLTEPLARAETLMSEALSSGALDDEAYLTVLTDLKTVGESNGLAALLDALGPALEDFLAIKDSGIGFDELLIGMMKEKLDQILSVVESGAGPGRNPGRRGSASGTGSGLAGGGRKRGAACSTVRNPGRKAQGPGAGRTQDHAYRRGQGRRIHELRRRTHRHFRIVQLPAENDRKRKSQPIDPCGLLKTPTRLFASCRATCRRV